MRRLAVAAARDTDRGFVMELGDVEKFVGDSKGRSEQTTARYRGTLEQLYEYLPEGKFLTYGVLEQWRNEITEKYSTSSVNIMITAVNSFLAYVDHRELQFTKRLPDEDTRSQKLTRDEYRRLLTGAKAMDDRRAYMLVKTFANTGIGISELEDVTVEAARAGRFATSIYGVKHSVRIPPVLCADLLEYARERGIIKGQIFRATDGSAMTRSAVTKILIGLSGPAQVPKDKCNARALRLLYLNTKAEAEDGVEGLVDRMMERQIEEEQVVIGWDS